MTAATVSVDTSPRSNFLRKVATPREVLAAANHTHLLMLLRWRQFSNARALLVVIGVAVLGGLFLFSSASLGWTVRSAAQTGYGTALGDYALNYLLVLNRGELGQIGSAAFAVALMASLFSPFTGATNLSVVPQEDLATLRPTPLHRFTDSLYIHAFSSIAMLQLLMLTGIASMVTLTGGRVGGLFATWGIWGLFLTLTITEAWGIEIVYRRYGSQVRRRIGFVLGVVVAGLVALDFALSHALFNGIGNVLFGAISSTDTIGGFLLVAAVIVGATLTSVFLGASLAKAALVLPAAVEAGRSKQYSAWVPSRDTVAVWVLLSRQMWRTAEVRRPMVTILLMGAPTVWITSTVLTSSDRTAMSTLVIAAPLAVALSWGVNVFGILGPGMPWLASQPTVMNRLPFYVAGIQIVTVILLGLVCWVPPLLLGGVSMTDTVSAWAGLLVCALLTTRSSLAKAVNRPMLTRLGSRGDTVVPPILAINYTLRLALWSGQIGVLVMNFNTVRLDSDTLISAATLQVAAVITVALWVSFRILRLNRRVWSDRDNQAALIATVAPV